MCCLDTGSRPPRILYFINSLDRGGAELGLIQLIRGGLFEGCELKVATIAQGDRTLAADLSALGVTPVSMIHSCRMSALDMPISVFRFLRLLRSYQPEVLILSLPQANLIGRACAAIERTNVVISFEHNTRLSKRLYEVLLRATSGTVTWMFADCDSTSLVAAERFYGRPPKTRSVVPLVAFPDCACPRSRTRNESEAFHVANAARFTSAKNQGALIRAVALLNSRGRRIRLTLFGDGPQRGSYEQLAKSLGISSDVNMPGFVKEWHKSAEADLFVVSSLREGQCLVALEAMHAGIPVLAPRVGGLDELAREGALIPLENVEPETIARQIGAIVDDPELRSSCIAHAASILDQRYSLTATRRVYQELNRALILASQAADDRKSERARVQRQRRTASPLGR